MHCIFFNVSLELKYAVVILNYGFCNSFLRCFTLNKIRKAKGSFYSQETRTSTVQFDVHCPNRFIRLHRVKFSISNYKYNF